MKKRIIAGAILAFIVLSAACLPALAAGAFPYEEYEKEGYNYLVRHNHDYETERGEVIFPSGLMLIEHINYKGYKHGSGRNHPLIDQTANLTVSLPDKITDDLGTTVSYQPYSFTTWGGDNYDETFEYSGAGQVMTRRNSVAYSVKHEFSISMISPDSGGDTVEEAIEKKAEYWSKYFKTDNSFGSSYNQAENPVTVEKYANCTVVIGREEQEHYYDRDNSLNKVKVYGFDSAERYDYAYRIYYAVPGIKGVFLEVMYSEYGSISRKIEDKAQGDYQKYINEYEKKLSEHRDLNFAEQLINLGLLITVTWDEPVVAESETEETGQNAGVTQAAEETPGEDSGVSVPAVIVLGVAAAGAAVAGAAAALGKGGDGDDRKKEEQKSYVMYVQKDFGDAIRRGADPVTVRARMAEIGADGKEQDRADLTAKITAGCEDAQLRGTRVSGRYFEAEVAVSDDEKANQATVSFIYNGPDATFTNRVVFRVVDGPSLEFGEQTPEGSGQFRFYSCNYGIDAIPGDGFTYPAFFRIVDAVKPPELSDITSLKVDGYEVEFEATKWQSVYRVIVKNKTPAEKNDDVFAKVKENRIEIRVNVEGEKDPVCGWLTMNMYPEGLTVHSKEEGKKNGVKYVRVQAYEKEHVGDLDKKWQVSEMTFTLAVKGEDKAVIDPKGMEFSFDKIKGGGGKGTTAAKEETIAEKFKYKESHGMHNEKYTYVIEPQSMLWEPDNGTFFILSLPVKCTLDGDVYKIDVPLRMRGKDIDPMEDWNREYAKARERIEKFSLPGQKAENLKKLEEIAAREPKISTWELRLMCKDVVRAYMKYWTEQHEKDEWTVAALDWAVWGLEWTKFIGDCAFSYVVTAYTGPLEAIISPAKDVFANLIGEIGVNVVWGTKFNPEKLEIYDAIKNAGDNFVSGGAADGISWLASSSMANPAKIKYACAIMGGYFVFAVANNYLLSLEKGENDFYGAVMGAFKDLTVTALKIAGSMMFKKWLDSPKFKREIGPKISEFINKKFGQSSALNEFLGKNLGNRAKIDLSDQNLPVKNTLGGLLNKEAEITGAGIIEKYVSELCGAAGTYVHEHPEKVEAFAEFVQNEHGFMLRFPLRVGISAAKGAAELVPAVTDAVVKTYMVEIDLIAAITNTTSELFGWFYEMFFGGLPAADSLMEPPKDPPLPPGR